MVGDVLSIVRDNISHDFLEALGIKKEKKKRRRQQWQKVKFFSRQAYTVLLVTFITDVVIGQRDASQLYLEVPTLEGVVVLLWVVLAVGHVFCLCKCWWSRLRNWSTMALSLVVERDPHRLLDPASHQEGSLNVLLGTPPSCQYPCLDQAIFPHSMLLSYLSQVSVCCLL